MTENEDWPTIPPLEDVKHWLAVLDEAATILVESPAEWEYLFSQIASQACPHCYLHLIASIQHMLAIDVQKMTDILIDFDHKADPEFQVS